MCWTELWTCGERQGRGAVSCDGNMECDGSLEFNRRRTEMEARRKRREETQIRKDS